MRYASSIGNPWWLAIIFMCEDIKPTSYKQIPLFFFHVDTYGSGKKLMKKKAGKSFDMLALSGIKLAYIQQSCWFSIHNVLSGNRVSQRYRTDSSLARNITVQISWNRMPCSITLPFAFLSQASRKEMFLKVLIELQGILYWEENRFSSGSADRGVHT